MILSGATGTFGVLSELVEGMNAIFGPGFVLTFEITMGILAALTGLGGLGIIIGGLILTTRRVEAGRIIILISLSTAVLSLFVTLVQHALVGVYAMDINQQVAQSLGWIGAIMAVISRIIAEQKSVMI
jgi:hypothetical protein